MSASSFMWALLFGSLCPQGESRGRPESPPDPRIFCHARVEKVVEVPQCPGRLRIHGVFMMARKDKDGKITGYEAPQRGHLDLVLPCAQNAKSDELYRQTYRTLAEGAGKGISMSLMSSFAEARIRLRKAGEEEVDPDHCVLRAFEAKPEDKASLEIQSQESASRQAIQMQQRMDLLALDLASDNIEVRGRATLELVATGKPVLETMKRLANSGKDAEIRARAARIVKEVEVALRPKVSAIFVLGKKEKDPVDAWKGEDWIRKAAAEHGYERLNAAGSLEGTEVSEERKTLYPETPSDKPGGLYIWGQIVEQTSDKTVIEISSSIKSINLGRFTLDVHEPRKLIRLTDQPSLGDLFIALGLQPGPVAPVKAVRK